jgi:hypothetical protein
MSIAPNLGKAEAASLPLSTPFHVHASSLRAHPHSTLSATLFFLAPNASNTIWLNQNQLREVRATMAAR